ncbi:MAG: OmpH family outer membrane protein [Salinimicrobium sp.]
MKRLLIVLSFGALLTSCDKEKTAYVDTNKLMEEYSEMKTVEADFTSRSENLKKELDSLGMSFREEVQEFQANAATMSKAEKEAAQQELMQKQQMLQQQQQVKSGQLRQESQVMMDSMINKVKDFVKGYGEENGYTYIFGSNESANILYAKEGKDITQEVLAELNDDADHVGTEE